MMQTSSSIGLSNFKSVCIIVVVIGCFAVLWPKIFYPMLLYGLHWGGGSTSTLSLEHNEQTLPPKVKEAMLSSPIKNPTKTKLPGRPQFYTGKREIVRNGPGQNSIWNVLVPLYALVLVVIFIYALFKLSLQPDAKHTSINENFRKEELSRRMLHNPDECKECQYDLMRREYTNKRYDPFLSRSTYRTFDYYGRRNVSRTMRSFMEDVKMFREQLIKAEICRCKLEKYDKEFNQAKSFVEKMEQVDNNNNDDEQHEEEVQISTLDTEHNVQLSSLEINNENGHNLKSDSIVEIHKNFSDDTGNVPQERVLFEENKENIENQNISTTNQPNNNQLENNSIVKRRKNKKNKMKINFNLQNNSFKEKSNTGNTKIMDDRKMFRTINHKIDKLIHLKKK